MTTIHLYGHTIKAGAQSTRQAVSMGDILAQRNADWVAFQADLQERLELQDYEVRDADPDTELSEPYVDAFYAGML